MTVWLGVTLPPVALLHPVAIRRLKRMTTPPELAWMRDVLARLLLPPLVVELVGLLPTGFLPFRTLSKRLLPRLVIWPLLGLLVPLFVGKVKRQSPEEEKTPTPMSDGSPPRKNETKVSIEALRIYPNQPQHVERSHHAYVFQKAPILKQLE